MTVKTNLSNREESISQTTGILKTMIGGLVDVPAGVGVESVCSTQSVIFEVTVDADDVRRVIGRKGRTANAVREILTNLGAKAGLRFHLEIVEPAGRLTVALGV